MKTVACDLCGSPDSVFLLEKSGARYAQSPVCKFIGPGWKRIMPNGHLSLFSPSTLRRFCGEAGLKILRIKTHGVRLRPNGRANPKGPAQLSEGVRKLYDSALTRILAKGDSIAVWAEKPG